MQEIIRLIQRKNQLQYDINCVRRYIESGEYDCNLKNAWDGFIKELEEVTGQLEKLRKPQLDDCKKRRMDLLEKIRNHEEQIGKLRLELEEIDKTIQAINK